MGRFYLKIDHNVRLLCAMQCFEQFSTACCVSKVQCMCGSKSLFMSHMYPISPSSMTEDLLLHLQVGAGNSVRYIRNGNLIPKPRTQQCIAYNIYFIIKLLTLNCVPFLKNVLCACPTRRSPSSRALR